MSLEQKKCRFINDCQHNNRKSQWILMLSRGCTVTSSHHMLPFSDYLNIAWVVWPNFSSKLRHFVQCEYFYTFKICLLWFVVNTLITKIYWAFQRYGSIINCNVSLRTSWKNLKRVRQQPIHALFMHCVAVLKGDNKVANSLEQWWFEVTVTQTETEIYTQG